MRRHKLLRGRGRTDVLSTTPVRSVEAIHAELAASGPRVTTATYALGEWKVALAQPPFTLARRVSPLDVPWRVTAALLAWVQGRTGDTLRSDDRVVYGLHVDLNEDYAEWIITVRSVADAGIMEHAPALDEVPAAVLAALTRWLANEQVGDALLISPTDIDD